MFWGIGVLFVGAILVLHVGSHVLLLAFMGALLGTALRGIAEAVSRTFHLPIGWSIAACIAAGTILFVGGIWLMAPRVAEQAVELGEALRRAYDGLVVEAQKSEVGQDALAGLADLGSRVGEHAMRAAGFVASAAGALGAAVFVMFVALYLALSPGVYRAGLVRLIPPRRRARADDVVEDLGTTLRRWMLSRMISMTAVGVATTIALKIIGVPLAGTLGVLAGLLGFVPNLGAIVSVVPAALIAFTVSPLHVVYTGIVYLVINMADGYGLTPLLEKKAVLVPPALVIVAQLVCGAMWGLLGVTLATPLLACAVIIIRKLYVEDVLETPVVEPAQTA